MRLLLRVCVALVLMTIAACDGGPREPGSAKLPELAAEELAAVPKPEGVYRQAYNSAEQEITAENAWERLNEIERAVDRGVDAVR